MNDPFAYSRDHNLPPGVTLSDIDEHFGGDEDGFDPDADEDDADTDENDMNEDEE